MVAEAEFLYIFYCLSHRLGIVGVAAFEANFFLNIR